MKTSNITILILMAAMMVMVLMAGCEEDTKEPNRYELSEPNEPAEPNAPRIGFRMASPPEQRGVLYFDAEEGKFKFEGDADLAAQKLFEMFQYAVDEYIKEHCPTKENNH